MIKELMAAIFGVKDTAYVEDYSHLVLKDDEMTTMSEADYKRIAEENEVQP